MNKFDPFLIRIFGPNDAVIGAGFLVSEHYALTCAHVVADALGIDRTTPVCPAGEVRFDFPGLDRGKLLQAKVVHWVPLRTQAGQPDDNEDIALLAMPAGLPARCQPAQLVQHDVAAGTAFHTIGFPTSAEGSPAIEPAEGHTKAAISGTSVTLEADKSFGRFVAQGFSGAPV